MARNETTATSTVLLNGEQAKQELLMLQNKTDALRNKYTELAREAAKYAIDDPKRYTIEKEMAKIEKQHRESKKELTSLKRVTFDYKKVLDDLSGSTLKDLYKAQRSIETQLKNGSIKRNTEEWKQALVQLKLVKSEIASVKNEMSIGESKWSKFTGGFGKMFAGIAIGGAIFSGLKSWYNDMVEFSSAVSQLSAITGAAGKDLDYLKNKAKELGAEYGKSATEIVEAMKLVGSAKPELLENASALSDMTESVLVLSKASGMDLGKTTENLATIMNQFGLSAAEANRTINALAAGSKYGSVEVDYLGDAISKVGAVADSAGINLETTVAVMELFGEKGIKAEVAGTGFRSTLVELQKDTKNYTNGVFDLNKAIDNNQSIAGDNIKLTEKFGKEYFNLAGILFTNKERFMQLNEQVTGTNTAFEQYAIATDNLKGDMDKLTGAWDAFILSLEDGNGPIANVFRNLIQFITEAVGGMEKLSKDKSQNNASATTRIVSKRVDSLKQELPNQKNQIEYINQEILAEKHLYRRKEERINQLKKDFKERERLGGAWDDNNDKIQEEIDGLQRAKNMSVAYINALGGLRKELTHPVTKDDKSTKLGGETDKEKKEREKADKKPLEDPEWQFKLNDEAIDKWIKKMEDYEKALSDVENMKFGVDEEIDDTEIVKYAKLREDFKLDELAKFKSQKEMELALVQEYLDKELLTEEEAARVRQHLRSEEFELKTKDAKAAAQEIANITSNLSSAIEGFQNAELSLVESRYDKEIAAARKAGRDTTALEEKKNEEMAAIRAKNADKIFALQVAGIIASTAASAIDAYASALKIPVAGLVLAPIAAGAAVAFGAAQIAQANAAREAAKEGYAEGGFTRPGGKYQPAGVVHAGEFVANQDAVGNNTLRRLFNVVDYAQKTNTVARIDNDAIARALSIGQGYSGGGFVAPAGNGGTSDSNTVNMAAMMAVMKQTNAVNAALLAEIRGGINSKVFIHGDNGLNKAQETYNKLIKNATK